MRCWPIGFVFLTMAIAGFSSIRAAGQDEPKKVQPGLAELLKSTPEEFIKRFDKNKDGYLTKDELPLRLAPLFDKADANGDGKLDQKEVAVLLQLLRKQLGQNPPPTMTKPTPNPQVDKLVANWLERFDTNKDGKISRAEAGGQLAANFDRFDINKDGFLDKEELRKVAEQFLGNTPPATTTPPRPSPPVIDIPDFDALDLNADGRLTREELKGTPYADKFDEMDTNKDGKIDLKEFRAYFIREAEKKAKQAEKKDK